MLVRSKRARGERRRVVYGCTCSSTIRDGLKFSRATRERRGLLSLSLSLSLKAAEICNLAGSIVSSHSEGKSTLEENRKKNRGLCTLKKVANHLRSRATPRCFPQTILIVVFTSASKEAKVTEREREREKRKEDKNGNSWFVKGRLDTHQPLRKLQLF